MKKKGLCLLRQTIKSLQHKQNNGTWIPQYHFSLKYLTVKDFIYSCHWTETSPVSHFTQRAVTTIATRTGRITLTDTNLTITNGEQKEKSMINTIDTRNTILKKYFGIDEA